MRGRTPTFDEGSVFYSARGFLLIVVFVFVAAILAQWLRRSIAYPDWVLTTIAALIAATFVFGSLVAYNWRVSSIMVKSEA